MAVFLVWIGGDRRSLVVQEKPEMRPWLALGAGSAQK
jgi:hypothetical protein